MVHRQERRLITRSLKISLMLLWGAFFPPFFSFLFPPLSCTVLTLCRHTGYIGYVIETRFASKPSITYNDWRNYFVWDLDIKATDVGLAVIDYFRKYPSHSDYLRNTLLLAPQFKLVNIHETPMVDTLMKAAIVSEVWVRPVSHGVPRADSFANDRADGYSAMMSATSELLSEPLSGQTGPMSTVGLSKVIQFSSPIMRSLVMQILSPTNIGSII